MSRDIDPAVEEQRLLAERAVAGDRVAMGQLLLDHFDGLTSFVSAKMPGQIGGVVEPTDIVQETLSAAWRDISRFEWRGAGSFAVWLRSIAEHRIFDAAKSLGRQKRGGDFRRVAATARSSTESMLDIFDQVAQDDSTPLRKASRIEAARMMTMAMAELPDVQREALRLRYVEGYSYDQIADALERTSQSVHGLIKRAKSSLREALGRASTYLSSR